MTRQSFLAIGGKDFEKTENGSIESHFFGLLRIIIAEIFRHTGEKMLVTQQMGIFECLVVVQDQFLFAMRYCEKIEESS